MGEGSKWEPPERSAQSPLIPPLPAPGTVLVHCHLRRCCGLAPNVTPKPSGKGARRGQTPPSTAGQGGNEANAVWQRSPHTHRRSQRLRPALVPQGPGRKSGCRLPRSRQRKPRGRGDLIRAAPTPQPPEGPRHASSLHHVQVPGCFALAVPCRLLAVPGSSAAGPGGRRGRILPEGWAESRQNPAAASPSPVYPQAGPCSSPFAPPTGSDIPRSVRHLCCRPRGQSWMRARAGSTEIPIHATAAGPGTGRSFGHGRVPASELRFPHGGGWGLPGGIYRQPPTAPCEAPGSPLCTPGCAQREGRGLRGPDEPQTLLQPAAAPCPCPRALGTSTAGGRQPPGQGSGRLHGGSADSRGLPRLTQPLGAPGLLSAAAALLAAVLCSEGGRFPPFFLPPRPPSTMHTGICGSTGSGHPRGEAEPRSCCRAGWKTPGRGSGGGQEHRRHGERGMQGSALRHPRASTGAEGAGAPRSSAQPRRQLRAAGARGGTSGGCARAPTRFHGDTAGSPAPTGPPGASLPPPALSSIAPSTRTSPPRRECQIIAGSSEQPLPTRLLPLRTIPTHVAPCPAARGPSGVLQAPPQSPRSAVPLTPMGATHALPARVPIPFPSLDRYK